jgi:hypothetical protein
MLTKKVSFTQAASVCLVAKHWDGQAGSRPATQGKLPTN